MPAKQKYLSSPWKRFSKVTSAILGGYIVTLAIHMAICKCVSNDTPVLMTSAYSTFLVWIAFMVLAFFIEKAWHVWILYALITLIGSILIYIN